uniref:Uncharacterized protein n=1 Tax=Acrobeloides nanus TaxID=290746 RepID=A0A914DMU7_9BILA
MLSPIYRPPTNTKPKIQEFIDALSECLSQLDIRNQPLLGDANIDWLTEQSEELRNLVELNDLQQNVKHLTHGSKLIDHFFTSKDINTQLCEHHDPIAKHEVISLRIHIQKPKQLKSLVECYNYKMVNLEAKHLIKNDSTELYPTKQM